MIWSYFSHPNSALRGVRLFLDRVHIISTWSGLFYKPCPCSALHFLWFPHLVLHSAFCCVPIIKNSSVRYITPGTLATTRVTPSVPSSSLNSFFRTLEPFGAWRCCQIYQGLLIRSDWDDFRQSSISGKHRVTTGNPLGINPEAITRSDYNDFSLLVHTAKYRKCSKTKSGSI